MRTFGPSLCILLTVFVVACGVVRAPTGTSGRFRALIEEDWRYWMQQYPELATQFGEPGPHDRWTDYSRGAISARAAHLRESLAAVTALDRASIGSDDQLNYDLYRDLLESAVAGLAFENDAMPIKGVIPHNLRMPMNQLEGLAQDVPLVISLMPATNVAEYEAVIRRLERVSVLVDQTIALMEQGLAAAMTPPRITFRDVPDQVRAQIISDPAASPLLAAFTTFPAAIAEADRVRLARAAAEAFTKRTRPAFEKLHDFLVRTYLPACRETTSVSHLPGGEEMYTYNVRWHTTTPETPEEIHRIGQAEVARIRAEMDAIIAKTGFTPTPPALERAGGDRFAAFAEFLRTSPEFYFTDAASLLAAYRDVAKRADPGLAALFGRLPQTPYGVVATPDAIAPSSTTAYYQPGALAAGRPGHMFANTYKLDSRPMWEMEALTLHEAVPGHHLQISIAQELEDVPAFRRNSSYTAFVEGWALYAESLGEEMGFYQDPYSKFGQLTYEMWRAVRLVVDTGLHSMGWTRQQAIDYFAANTPKTIQDITVEVDRYIVWPGQALGYKMGQLKIRALRAEAEARLGEAFDIRAFHDRVLGAGAVPMTVLEQRLR